jgi:hypothetical protein
MAACLRLARYDFRMKKVLLVGLDPHAVPGVDATLVDQAIAMSDARFAAAQIECVSCLFPPERSAAVAVTRRCVYGSSRALRLHRDRRGATQTR